jgi:nicotinamide-nucleotide amidase
VTPESSVEDLVDRVHRALLGQGATVAVAESLTGGLLCGVLTGRAGASRVVRGGVVAYATDLKQTVLGVDADLLSQVGAVDEAVARAMAAGARARLGSTYGLATTGVAGPDPQDGRAPGEVYVAVHGPDGASTLRLDLSGDRSEIRAGAVAGALQLLLDALGGTGKPDR